MKGDRMSWGERSCERSFFKTGKICEYTPKMLTCNVDCEGYDWDKKTPPDSISWKQIKDDINRFKIKQ
jgi:hypothetical protein